MVMGTVYSPRQADTWIIGQMSAWHNVNLPSLATESAEEVPLSPEPSRFQVT